MADSDRMRGIERITARQFSEETGSANNVLKRSRPATAVADPSVLEIPHHESLRGQCTAHRRDAIETIRRAPKPAVDGHDDSDSARGTAIRQIQIAELRRILA